MDPRIAEIADGIYRISIHVPEIAPPAGFTFNQFLVLGDEPLLFHTGYRRMFPFARAALARIIPPERLRWITFGHYESDECGALNEWLAIAPEAQAAHGQTGVMVSLNDFADRSPRILADGETIDIGGRRLRWPSGRRAFAVSRGPGNGARPLQKQRGDLTFPDGRADRRFA